MPAEVGARGLEDTCDALQRPDRDPRAQTKTRGPTPRKGRGQDFIKLLRGFKKHTGLRYTVPDNTADQLRLVFDEFWDDDPAMYTSEAAERTAEAFYVLALPVPRPNRLFQWLSCQWAYCQ